MMVSPAGETTEGAVTASQGRSVGIDASGLHAAAPGSRSACPIVSELSIGAATTPAPLSCAAATLQSLIVPLNTTRGSGDQPRRRCLEELRAVVHVVAVQPNGRHDLACWSPVGRA